MGKKTYSFPHSLGKEEALKRAKPMAENLARKYMMKTVKTADNFHITNKNTKATIVITDNTLEITMELSLLIEKLAGSQIDSELNYKVPKALA